MEAVIKRYVKDERLGWEITEQPITYWPWDDSRLGYWNVILWDWSHGRDNVRVAFSAPSKPAAVRFCRNLGWTLDGSPVAFVSNEIVNTDDDRRFDPCCAYNPKSIVPGAIRLRRPETDNERGLANAQSARTQLRHWDCPGLR